MREDISHSSFKCPVMNKQLLKEACTIVVYISHVFDTGYFIQLEIVSIMIKGHKNVVFTNYIDEITIKNIVTIEKLLFQIA